MLRKVVTTDGRGNLREEWVDMGPYKALVGHGRPTLAVASNVLSANNVAVSDGSRQRRLHPGL